MILLKCKVLFAGWRNAINPSKTFLPLGFTSLIQPALYNFLIENHKT